MNAFTFACAKCNRPLSATPDKVGKRGKCPACQNHFTIPAQGAEPARVVEVEPVQGTVVPPAVLTPTPGSPPPSWPVQTATPAKAPELVPVGTTQLVSWRATERPLLQGLISLGAGAALTVALYAILRLFKGGRFYEIMSGSLSGVGWWITPLEVFFFFWACAILVLKMIKMWRERQVFGKDLLLRNVPTKINRDNAHQFLTHLKSVERNPRSRFLTNRAWLALTHLKGGATTPEVANAVTNQSAIDASIVQSGYVILKVFIWAIPILGFIGTVLGISAAIGDFNEVTKQAEEMTKLKDGLGLVTTALAVAFNTTLVALMLSLLLMFWTSAVQKREEDLLTQADEFCNEQLLTKLQATGEGGPGEEIAESIRALAEKLDSPDGKVGPQLEEAARRISEALERRGQEVAGENREIARKMADAGAELQQSLAQLAPIAQQLAATLTTAAEVQKQLASVHRLIEEMGPAMKRLSQPLSIQILRDEKGA